MKMPVRAPSEMNLAREIVAYYNKGHSMVETAQHFGLTRDKTQRCFLEAGGITRKVPNNGFKSLPTIDVIELTDEPIKFDDLAEQLGIAVDTAKSWTKQGYIPGHLVGGKWFVYASEVEGLTAEDVRKKMDGPVINTEPVCASCGILLSEVPHTFDVCDLCRRWCKWDPISGEWIQKRLSSTRRAVA